MRQNEEVGSRRYRRHVAQLQELRRAERAALALFTHLVEEADDEIGSLLRSIMMETEVQLVRLDRLAGPGVPDAAASDIVKAVPCVYHSSAAIAASRCLDSQISAYQAGCKLARELGDYDALDILLLNLDEDVASQACLARFSSEGTSLLRAI